ncbi:MAG: branched-chain amino acid ABC transporter permease [Planctomycetota bacterium]
MDYSLHILILVAIYAGSAISLDLIAGHTGLVSLCHAAFHGLGAYTTALLATRAGIPFPVSILAGVVIAVLLSFAISLPSFRLHGDYFTIATFGFQMILFGLFNNWIELTRGPLGVPGIPAPVIFGWHVDTNLEFLVLAASFCCFSGFVVYRITNSPFGRVLHAIREDEVFAQANGKNTLYYKVAAFAVSAALASSAGSISAHYVTFIDPTSFTVMESILVLSMVIIGGAGSPLGPMVGAMILVTLPEALRFMDLPTSVAANLRQMIYGSLLVVMMMFRPQGLVGRYRFGR